MTCLFDPIQLGAIAAPNRIIMAPLTRCRATQGHVPNPIQGDYYAQRATAGLILSEATGISQEGLGTCFAPGIWSDEQTEAWKPIVEQMHQAGGRIFCQLWHMGRLVHPDFNDGNPPISSSATTGPGNTRTYEGKKPYVEARPLELSEIPRLLDDYANAAENAKRAGFDGVQLHSANGYLIDQFIRSGTNHREDDYGGSIANRIRLLGEVTQRLVGVWGKTRVAVRLSPNGDSQGADDATPNETFSAAAKLLSDIGIAFLELREPPPFGTYGNTDIPAVSPHIRKVFDAPLILNSDYDKARAEAALAEGKCDAISFGRPFITNPDLVERLRSNAPLNPALGGETPWHFTPTWYLQSAEGYTDYPTLKQATRDSNAA
ncbi:alkene reductase [Alterisphingorhabdus coralli]|uniref:Alkene reductase n=1 Tax=Alterisphingorhabdus coralli TaxID=3071408 RepID=A0AA97F729_9SPHN|nr:alkene reductase [Parasphingorhabdus sp. SCSIO 66989]WOE75163.1 alkene reductase [Parasphingorhabdus sp. SCSIO 66989]